MEHVAITTEKIGSIPEGTDHKIELDGAILEPGDHVIEMAFGRPCPPEALTQALYSMGFSDAIVDQGPERYILLGRLARPIALRQLDEVSWIFAHRLAIDAFSDLRFFKQASPESPSEETHSLEPERVYELRFLSRMSGPRSGSRTPSWSRSAVLTDLAAMGFEVQKLLTLKKDMRIPGRPGASVTLWLGLARWTGPMSYISPEDPFYFEDVKAI